MENDNEKYSQAVISLFTVGPKPMPVKPTVDPKHVQIQKEINFDVKSTEFLRELSRLYHEYLNKKDQAGEHASAWDEIGKEETGGHGLNMELQLELNRLIRSADEEFFKSAFVEEDYVKKLFARKMESGKPFRKRRGRKTKNYKQTTPLSFLANLNEKRAKLASFGIPDQIIDSVIAENQKKNFNELTIEATDKELPDAIKVAEASGFFVRKDSIRKIKDGMFSAEVLNTKATKSLKETRVCVVGLPSDKRAEIAEKLSSFYGVPHMTLRDILKVGLDNAFFSLEQLQNSDIANDMVEVIYHSLAETMDTGFVLEGYPCTKEQSKNMDVDAVVFVDFPLDNFIDFQGKKKWCPSCMLHYHDELHPCKGDTVCSRCGTGLTVQTEDQNKIIKNRYYTWRRTLADVLKYFRIIDKMIEIQHDKATQDALSDIEKTFKKWKIRSQ